MINVEYIRGLDDGHCNESRHIKNSIAIGLKMGWTVEDIVNYLNERNKTNDAIRKNHRKIQATKGLSVGT